MVAGLSGKTWEAGEALGPEHRADHNNLPGAFNIYEEALNNRGIDVTLPPYNAKGDGVTDDTQAFLNAMSDAHDIADAVSDIYAYPVIAPPGRKYLVRTLSFSGLKTVLVGGGPAATRLKAHPDIAGYVIDLDGWKGYVPSHMGNAYFGGFTIEGTGVADATLATGGLRMSLAGNFLLSDITVMRTGGPAMYVGAGAYLGNYERITLQRPIGADTNDVPYLHIFGSHNGNRWNSLGFRSTSGEADGSSVMLVEQDPAEGGGNLFPSFNSVIAPWLEFQHTPEGGTIFDLDAKNWIIDGLQPFDGSSAVDNPTLTSVFTLRGDRIEIRGYIPGRGGSAKAYRFGVVVSGSRNRIVGWRGYRDNNVRIDSGSGFNYIELGGNESGSIGVGGAAVVDNSGETTNWILDRSLLERPTYAPSNVTTDRTFDADSTTTAELADVLGTLISDLQDQGVIG